jgi:hypothetical protein
MKSMISPNFSAEKIETGKLEDWIDVFENRIVNWTLRQARSLLKISDNDYAITQLLIPYFEGISIYLKGQDSSGRSKQFFKEGFLSVFLPGNIEKELLERIAEVLYEDARCGFFHDNMIRSRIFFSLDNSRYSAPFNITLPKINGKIDYNGEIQSIIINTEMFLNEVEGHFEEYIKKLRDKNNLDLRERFKEAWEIKHPPGRPPKYIA